MRYAILVPVIVICIAIVAVAGVPRDEASVIETERSISLPAASDYTPRWSPEERFVYRYRVLKQEPERLAELPDMCGACVAASVDRRLGLEEAKENCRRACDLP